MNLANASFATNPQHTLSPLNFSPVDRKPLPTPCRLSKRTTTQFFESLLFPSAETHSGAVKSSVNTFPIRSTETTSSEGQRFSALPDEIPLAPPTAVTTSFSPLSDRAAIPFTPSLTSFSPEPSTAKPKEDKSNFAPLTTTHSTSPASPENLTVNANNVDQPNLIPPVIPENDLKDVLDALTILSNLPIRHVAPNPVQQAPSVTDLLEAAETFSNQGEDDDTLSVASNETDESFHISRPGRQAKRKVTKKEPKTAAKAPKSVIFHTCSICLHSFSRKYNLKTHLETHNKYRDRAHKCPKPNCTKSFVRIHDLQRHLRIHDAPDMYQCLVCGKGFSRKDALERHFVVKGH